MNKFLDDISEYKIVDKLKEKLQESENLKLEIEAILIKRVRNHWQKIRWKRMGNIAQWPNKWVYWTKTSPYHQNANNKTIKFFIKTECTIVGAHRGVGTIW